MKSIFQMMVLPRPKNRFFPCMRESPHLLFVIFWRKWYRVQRYSLSWQKTCRITWNMFIPFYEKRGLLPQVRLIPQMRPSSHGKIQRFHFMISCHMWFQRDGLIPQSLVRSLHTRIPARLWARSYPSVKKIFQLTVVFVNLYIKSWFIMSSFQVIWFAWRWLIRAS